MGALLTAFLLADLCALVLSRAHFLATVCAMERLLALMLLMLRSVNVTFTILGVEMLTLRTVRVAIAPTAGHGRLAGLATDERHGVLRAAHLCGVFTRRKFLSHAHITDDVFKHIHLVAAFM